MAKVIKVKGDAGKVESDFTEAPPGLYIGKVAEITAKKSESSGNPMVEVVWQIVKNGDGSKLKDSYGRVWYYAPVDITKIGTDDDEVHPGYARRLKELLTAFGLPLKGADLGKIENKEALLRLKEDQNQDGDYRPRIAKILKKGTATEKPEADEDEDESGESGDEDELYTEDELKDLSNDDLKAVAEEYEVELPSRMTVKAKGKLVAAILEAQGGEDDDDEEEEDEDEEEGDEVDLDELDRKELKAFRDEQELDFKVTSKMSDDDIRAKIRELMEEDEEEEDGEEEDEDEGDNYDDMDVAELRQECEDRELDSKGKKSILVARLRKDDSEEPV